MANQVRADFVSDKVTAVYDMTLLERIVPGMIWDKFAQSKLVPANSNTKTAFAIRYKNILPTTTPLAEYNGTVKQPRKVVREEVPYTVAHYGDYIEYSDELDLYDFRKITSDFLNILGDHAAVSMETVKRNSLRGGTNVVYANGKISRAEVIATHEDITKEDIRTAILKLKAQGAKKLTSMIQGTTKVGTKPVRACYVGVCSIYTTESLRKLEGWQDAEEYADASAKLDEREIGRILDVRFIESDNDEGVECNSAGAPTVGGGEVVEQTLIFGADAYATTTVRGKGGIQTKVKPIGSAGSKDPLDQFGTIGWKAIVGCAILNQAWLVRIEHQAADAVVSNKHYYDYTPGN